MPIIPDVDDDVDDTSNCHDWCVAHVSGTTTCAGPLAEPAPGVHAWLVHDAHGPGLVLDAPHVRLTPGTALALRRILDEALRGALK